MRLNKTALSALILATTSAIANVHAETECIVPSKPGGGMDLTCKLAQKGLQDIRKELKTSPPQAPLHISYLPGGIGAVAWNSVVSQRRAEADTLIVFSGGSLLNLAQGKFGKASAADVRWVAAIGVDYGMIAVPRDSPYKNLRDLVDALKRDPAKIAIGASGTSGSQDWVKMALIARQGNINPKALRLVAFEGGGESFTALLAGHVQAVSGEVSEATRSNIADKIRVLAVLADARLPGTLSNIATAREQGFDVTWPVVRGVYMGPQVSDADYHKWISAFDRMMALPSFAQYRAENGLYPFALTGAPLTEYVKKSVDNYGEQVKKLGLVR